MQTIDSPIVFSRAGSRTSRMEWVVLLAVVLGIVGTLVWAFQWELIKAENVKKLFANFGWRDVNLFFVFLLPPLAAFGVQRLYRYAVLTIDADGLRLETSKGPLWARKLIERKMLWSDIEKVTYLASFGTLHMQPHNRYSRPWGLRVNEWKLNEVSDNTSNSGDKAKKKEADLVRIFREKGILDGHPPDSRLAAAEFDLMRHPGTRATLLGLGVLALYSAVDGFLNHETWADFSLNYYFPHLIAGVIGVVAAACFLVFGKFDKRVPDIISMGLAVVFGLALGVASYIGGTRLNQWMGGPLVEETYHRDATCLYLVPENKLLPRIEYADFAKKYWCSIDAKEPVKVSIRKGLFGLYQVDLRKQTQAIREYWETHR